MEIMVAQKVEPQVYKKSNRVNKYVFQKILFPVFRLIYICPELIHGKPYEEAHKISYGFANKIILRKLQRDKPEHKKTGQRTDNTNDTKLGKLVEQRVFAYPQANI
jgi:hypothetical protein